MKIIINKLVGDLGEQWALEIPVGHDVLKARDPVAAIKAQAAPILRVVDDRLLELNMRLLDSNRLAQSLTPEALLALRQTVEIMYGRRVAPDGQGGSTQGMQAPPSPAEGTTAAKAEVAGKALEKALEAVDEGR